MISSTPRQKLCRKLKYTLPTLPDNLGPVIVGIRYDDLLLDSQTGAVRGVQLYLAHPFYLDPVIVCTCCNDLHLDSPAEAMW